ncbi:MAG: hypothetical protein GWP19_12390 [Planctomycetia bacterium]|nr:hypothetical protein [Planctomycetia bacterium]
MNKYLLIIVLCISISFGLNDDIPYDWSGQYGVISNNGRLMWNQDWELGVLLIDGTFANYPTRFGSSYKNNFRLSNTGEYYKRLYSFPDSSQIKSSIDYYRGDFSYDQLEIDAQFSEKTRIISFNGFKRTYNGPYGQFIDSNGVKNPLQQSYRIDYSSKKEDELLDVSIGYFITDSRLNLNDPADFIHKEKIISAGIGYSKNFATWQYKNHGAFFQQYYKFYKINGDSVRAYLNRFHLNQVITKKLKNSDLLKFGIEVDNQALSTADAIRQDRLGTKKDRSWSTIYGGWEKQSFGLKIGTTIAQKEIVPYFNIFTHSKNSKLIKWNSYLKYEAVPKQIFNWYRLWNKLFEKWLTAHFYIGTQWKNIPVDVNIDWINFQRSSFIDYGLVDEVPFDLSNNLISGSIATEIPLIRAWKININYRHTFESNFYSDGIGDRVQVGVTVNERLFKNNMLASLRLWGDAYLNHHSNLVFMGFHYGQYYNFDTKSALSDYWVFNFELSAKISKMTIMWKVNNILQTAESITNQLFPNLDENYLLITNNNNFPPMNRFITFNVIWNFEN